MNVLPDKIYVPQHNIEAGNIQELGEPIVAGSTEYIRKDAIMEWAKEGKEHYKKLMKDFPDLFAASFGAYNAFVEKLNSL